MKETIPQVEVEKAQAIAGFAAGQTARAKGFDPAAFRALATFGKETRVGELVLLPQSLQVQLCLIEHSALFEGHLGEAGSLSCGLKRLTHLAFIFADPDAAFAALTDPAIDEASRRSEFSLAAFELARHFQTPEQIELMTAHISAQMGLMEDAAPAPAAPEKKPARRMTPPARRRLKTGG